MKKALMFSGAAVAVMLGGAGCAMCTAPIPNDPSCTESSHLTDTNVSPLSLAKVAPHIAPADRQFRPIFRAGAKVYGSGDGFSEEEALNAAIDNILTKEKCDYLVAVNHISTCKTHPSWRFFATTNYMVKISAIPIYLERLVEEPVTKEELAARTTAATDPGAKNSGSGNVSWPALPIISGACPSGNQPLALIKLTDIEIKARGVSDEKAGVIIPLK